MSNVIDERVVSMKFDNSGFEKNVESSIKSLENLNKSIDNMSSVNVNSFKNLSSTISGFNLDPISNSLDAISSKFSAWSVAGITAIQNVVNKAVDAGTQIVKSLTIDPVSTGFSEYELKMGSVQTIMNGANVDLQTTMDTLEELNKYADRTIYSFSDMTTNIGKFVNAGVELDTAVDAIKGISNEAALAGANATEASRAMYNIAQAIGTGSMKLIDWKSIENANMATMQFKQTLIDTGKELGTISSETSKVEAAQLTAENFRESISGVEGQTWITNDVMMKALAKYSDETSEIGKKAYAAAQDVKTFSMLMDTLKEAAQSGWAETMENIFGDFEQAKAMWTAVNNEISGILDAQAKERNDLLKAWKDNGGRDALLNSVANIWFSLKDVIIDVKAAFEKVFPKMTSTQLIKITKNVEALTKKFRSFIESSKIAKTIAATFIGIFYAVKQVISGFKNLLSIVKPLFETFKAGWNEIIPTDFSSIFLRISNAILNVGIAFNKATVGIKDFLTNSKNLSKIKEVFKGITSAVDILRKVIVSIGNVAKSILEPILSGFLGSSNTIASIILNLAASIGKIFTSLNSGFSVIKDFEDFKNRFEYSIKAIKNALDLIFNGRSARFIDLRHYLSKLGFNNDTIKNIADFVGKLSDKFKELKELFTGGFDFDFHINTSKIGSNLIDRLTIVKNKVVDILRELKESFSESKFISNFINSISGLLDVFSSFTGVLGSALNAISAFFDGFATAMRSSPIMTMSVMFSGISKIIDSINSGKIVSSAKNISEFFDTIGEAVEKFEFGAQVKSIKSFAIAIAILAGSLLVLSAIDVNSLATSILALVILMASMVAVAEAITVLEVGSFTKVAASMVIMSAAVSVLAGAMHELSDIKSENIATSILSILSLMVGLVAVAEAVKVLKVESFIKTAASMLIFANGIKVLANAVATLSSIQPESLFVGMIAFTVMLGEMVIALKMLSDSNLTFGVAAGFLALAVGLKVIANSISTLGNLTADQITQGFVGFAIILAAILVFCEVCKDQLLSTGVAILLVAVAMNVLVTAIAALGSMKFETLAKGIGAIVVVLLAIVGVSYLMEGAAIGAVALVAVLLSLVPVLLSLAVVIAAVAIAAVALAASIKIITDCIQQLGEMDSDSLKQGIIGLGAALVILAAALLIMNSTLIGSAALLVASIALVALAGALTLLGQLSIEQIITSLIAIAGAIAVFAAAALLVTPLLVPMLGLAAVLVLLSASVAIVGAGLLLIGEGLGLVSVNGPLGVSTMQMFLTLISANLKPLTEFAGILTIIGLALIVFGAGALVAGSGCTLLGAGLIVLSVGLLTVAGAAIVLVKAFNYILEQIPELKKNFDNVIKLFKDSGGNIVQGIIDGINGKIKDAKKKVKEFGQTLLTTLREKLKIKSPSRETKSDGENFDKGFEKGVESGSDSANDTVSSFGSGLLDSFKKYFSSDTTKSTTTDALSGITDGITDSKDGIFSQFSDLGKGSSSSFLDGLGELSGGTVDLDTSFSLDADTSKIQSMLQSGDVSSFSMSDLGLDKVTTQQDALTDSINKTTEATKEETKATEELKYTREALIEDFKKNGTSLYRTDDEAQKSYYLENLNNLDISGFNKFVENYGLSLDEIEKKTGASLSEVATLFDEILNTNDGDDFSTNLITSLTDFGNEANRKKIKEIYESNLHDVSIQGETRTVLENNKFLEDLGFKSCSEMNDIFEDIKNSASEASDAVSDTTKKAAISASELEEKAKEVIAGKYGNGADRIKALGDQYAVIQNKVNEMLGSSVRHETDIEVVADTTSVDEASEKVDALTEKTSSYQKSVLANADKLPTSVAEAVKKQMSYQDQLLQNESKLPSEVVAKLKEITGEAQKTDDLVQDSSAKSTETLDRYASYLDSVQKNADKLPSSVKEAIESAQSSDSITITPEVDTTEVTEATADVDDLTSSLMEAAGVDITPTVDTESVSESLASVQTEVTPTFNLSNIDTKDIQTKLTSALNESAKDIPVTVTAKVNFEQVKNQFFNFFNTIGTSIETRATTYTQRLNRAFDKVLSGTVDELKNIANTDFVKVGSYFAIGMVKGINKEMEVVKAAAIRLAKAALNSMKKELDINSPSKETEQLGKYADIGLANGLDKYVNLVENSSTGVATTVQDALKGTLSDLDLEGIDTTPTIRPVLDLSDVESKSSLLSSMFSQDNVARISASFEESSNKDNEANQMMTSQMNRMNEQMARLINVMSSQEPTPVDVNVELQGDAKNLFNMIRKQGQAYTRTTGRYAF